MIRRMDDDATEHEYDERMGFPAHVEEGHH